jgi:hypothetical protein
MANLPKVAPALPFPFMRFDLGKYAPHVDQLVKHRGTPILLTPHVICPCIQPPKQGGTGVPVPDCPECGGTGFSYVGNGDEVLAGVIGVNADDTRLVPGRMDAGQIRVVLPSEVTIASGDRIQLHKSIVPIRYSRKFNKSLGGLRLPFDVRDVKVLTTNRPSTLEIVELERGRDYGLDTDKNILSLFGDRVADNNVVSGVYMASPYYIVIDLSSAFRGQNTPAFSADGSEEWVKFPQSCTAERADLLAHGRFHHEVSQQGSIDTGEGY